MKGPLRGFAIPLYFILTIYALEEMLSLAKVISSGSWEQIVAQIVGLAASICIIFGVRWPRIAGVVTLGLGAFLPWFGEPLWWSAWGPAFLLLCIAERWSRLVLWTVGATAYAVVIVHLRPETAHAIQLVPVPFFIAMGLGLRLVLRKVRAMASVIDELENQHMIVRETERSHLAGEVSRIVASHTDRLDDLLSRSEAETSPDRLRRVYAEVDAISTEALSELRMLVGVLRPLDDSSPAESEVPRVDLIQQLNTMKRTLEGHPVAVRLEVGPGIGEIPASQQHTASLVVANATRELLANLPSTSTTVASCEVFEGELHFNITSHIPGGVPRALRKGESWGPLRERVSLSDGSTEIRTQASTWSLHVMLPSTRRAEAVVT